MNDASNQKRITELVFQLLFGSRLLLQVESRASKTTQENDGLLSARLACGGVWSARGSRRASGATASMFLCKAQCLYPSSAWSDECYLSYCKWDGFHFARNAYGSVSGWPVAAAGQRNAACGTPFFPLGRNKSPSNVYSGEKYFRNCTGKHKLL